MKLLHISDLHIGKRLYGFDLEDDQRHVLSEIIKIIEDEKPDAVLIAGDIYDRADPSASSVRIFDDFLSMLANTDTQVFIIYGNHDSASRIAYGSRILGNSGIHISPVYDSGTEPESAVRPVRLNDEYGPVDFYMLPYLRAEDAAEALKNISPDEDARNVIISHQFVTSAVLGDSEEMNVGTLDNIDASLYGKFDYAALGHIHMPQDIDAGKSGCRIRYSGSPLSYSFSESDLREKSVTAAELGKKGDISLRQVPLTPLRRMVTVKAGFDELIGDSEFIETHKEDFIKVILTDDKEIMDAMTKLQAVLENVMSLEYEYMSRQSEDMILEETRAEGTPGELFSELYKDQHDGEEPDNRQLEILDQLIASIWEDGNETD